MNLVARAQAIILKPKEEWVKIKGESTPIAQLFMSYAVILAAIPAIARFIGFAVVSRGHINFGRYLLQAVLSYVFSLAITYLFGIVINLLAPNFGSKPSLENAMKLAVYSMTPAWIGGIFYIIPALSVLAILASLYGLYILYLGFSLPMMDTPKDNLLVYLLVSFVVVTILVVVADLLIGSIFLRSYSQLLIPGLS